MKPYNSNDKATAEMENIAILGGTFDPIHKGHIACGHHVANWLNLDEVILLPAHIPPHKQTTSASALHRAAMVKCVCQQDVLFKSDNRELERQTPSFTVETLTEIKKQKPSSRLYFIIGMDSLLALTTWKKWQQILTLCNLVVNPRPNYHLSQLSRSDLALLSPYLKNNDQYASFGQILFSPPLEQNVASSIIRPLIKQNNNWQSYLPSSVAHYIKHHQLYRH